ncbi:hypothetical protein [Chitinilyticum litopenaei]|uniref:hypothetical protein n=1 Tax=Chitinilyticum litopenaei TaxID=1121276 RepID=UPI000417C01D|nr:hypothetical protein [Chitinilyticum litopenaei]
MPARLFAALLLALPPTLAAAPVLGRDEACKLAIAELLATPGFVDTKKTSRCNLPEHCTADLQIYHDTTTVMLELDPTSHGMRLVRSGCKDGGKMNDADPQRWIARYSERRYWDVTVYFGGAGYASRILADTGEPIIDHPDCSAPAEEQHWPAP